MQNVRWMPLFGQFEVGGESVRFIPSSETDDSIESKPSTAQIASNLEFAYGDISFDVMFQEPKSVCTVVLNTNDSSGQLHIGLNLGGAFGVAKLSDAWDILKSVGTVEQLQPNQTYHLRISVSGVGVSMFVNDVLVLEVQASVSRSPIHLYAYGRRGITFSRFRCDRPRVFVSLPEPIYTWCGDDLHRLVSESLLEVNEINLEYSTVEEIDFSIQQSVGIITNVSPDYPIGMYNVGLSRGLGKPTLVLCNKSDRDIYNFYGGLTQMVYHDDSSAGIEHVVSAIARFCKLWTPHPGVLRD